MISHNIIYYVQNTLDDRFCQNHIKQLILDCVDLSKYNISDQMKHI